MGAAARLIAFAAALAGALFVAAVSLRPPAERPGEAFSPETAMTHIRAIASEPHPTGSAANDAARDYLVGALRDLGLSVGTQPFEATTPRRGLKVRGVNIVARLPGADPSLPPIVLMAHYDSAPGSPGAADDAVGVAAALEAARVLKDEPRRRDLIVLLTDAEELGLLGARAWFASAAPTEAVVNLEARGGGGRVAMFETGAGAGGLMRLFAHHVRSPTSHSVAVLIYRILPNDTDFTVAREAGHAGLNLAFIGDPRLYHSPLATPDRVDPGAIRHMGYLTIDLVRALLNAPEIERGGPEPVFSDVFGHVLIVYPARAGWIPIGAAALLIGVAGAVSLRRTRWRMGALIGGLGAAAGFVAISAAALHGMNLVSGHGPDAAYYDRLAATGWLEIQAFLLLLAIVLILPRRWCGLWGGWLGFLLLGLAAAVAAQVFAPQAGPLLAWPLMMAAALAAGVAVFDAHLERRSSLVLLAVGGAVIAGFVFYWAHLMFVGAGQAYASAMAPFAFLALLVLWPLAQALPGRRTAALAALVLVLASASLALMVRLDPVSPYAVSLIAR